MAAQKPSWQRSALSQLKHWNPDVVGLSEFRESATSQAIAESLAGIGLTYQQTTVGASDRRRNFCCWLLGFLCKLNPLRDYLTRPEGGFMLLFAMSI